MHKWEVLIAFNIFKEVAKIFEYSQEDSYWNWAKIVNRIWEKALLIAQTLYPEYQIIFMLDNAKSHAIFTKNIFWVVNMSKRLGEIQNFLRNR